MYLCLDCAKNVDKNWNITVSFIIHVNFDHVWVEYYPVTKLQVVYYLLQNSFNFEYGKHGHQLHSS